MKDPSPGRGRLSTTRPACWWVWNLVVAVWGSGGGTLLGPEGSGPDRPGDGVVSGGWFFVSPLSRSAPVGVGGGLVGWHLDDLNSGREHLVADLHQDPLQDGSVRSPTLEAGDVQADRA